MADCAAGGGVGCFFGGSATEVGFPKVYADERPDPKIGAGGAEVDSAGADRGSLAEPFVAGGAPNRGFVVSESDFLKALPNTPNPPDDPNTGAVMAFFGSVDTCAPNNGIVGASSLDLVEPKFKVGTDFVSTGFSVTLRSSTEFGISKSNFGISSATRELVGLTFGGDVASFAAVSDDDPPNLNPPFTAGVSATPFEVSCDNPPNELCEGGRLNWNFGAEG
jgi:hypothetical protein